MIPAKTIKSIRQGLWENSKDSIRHSLEHFREVAITKDDKAHHQKWAILSVHQAAEAFCNILLLEGSPESIEKDGALRFPSLRFTIDRLLADTAKFKLSLGEQRLIQILKELPEVRDQLMHRPLPNALDHSVAAISLLGLLRFSRNRIGEPASRFEYDSPRIEADVFSTIPYKRVEGYCRLAEELLREEYPAHSLGFCGNCGTHSILSGHCEICFEEMGWFDCLVCGEGNYYAAWELLLNPTKEFECSACGKINQT